MKNRYAAAFEWIIAIFLIILCINTKYLSYGSFTPIAAHQKSERTYYYGPSEIADTIKLDGTILYLCRYKEWYSLSIVKKGLLRWQTAGLNIGNKIDPSAPINYSRGFTRINKDLGLNKIYGNASDPEIVKVVLENKDGSDKLQYELDSDRLFVFYWQGEDMLYKYDLLKGLDKSGNIKYETMFLNP